MADNKQKKISIDMSVAEPQYLILDSTSDSVLFEATDKSEYVYSIYGKKMANQSDTTVNGVKKLNFRKECDLSIKSRTNIIHQFNITEDYRGYILRVDFLKPEGSIPCAQHILIVQPVTIKVSQVLFLDSNGKANPSRTVLYEAGLRFSLQVKYNRNLLREEKEPKPIVKAYRTDPSNKSSYIEVSDIKFKNSEENTDIFHCNVGLQESHAGASYAFSLGCANLYESPFKTKKQELAPSVQIINLVGRKLKRPQITSVVWSSKEMIKFNVASPKREEICYNEDGFLHIHTRGMYGQRVRIELYEKDSTGVQKLLLGLKSEVLILDNTAYVPVEMSGLYAQACKGRNKWIEGLSFEIMAKVTPKDPSIAPFEGEIINLKIYGKAEDNKAAKATIEGTQKFVIANVKEEKKEQKGCGGKYCITKENYKEKNAGKLIQEINIRLAGFGGNVPTEEFDDRTEAVIKQFQRDYMKTAETGKICGSLLAAIDEFCSDSAYNISFDEVKCKCGKCTGFGDKSNKGKYLSTDKTEKYHRYEYPGIHRSLIFAIKGLIFYLKETKPAYSLYKINSGYRCRYHIEYKKNPTTNHMGKAFDLLFNKNKIRTKETDDMELIRKDIFCKYMNAPEKDGGQTYGFGWKSNHIGLEPKKFNNGKTGADTWIHVDVREFSPLEYLTDNLFISSIDNIITNKMVDIAKSLNLTDMSNCNNWLSKRVVESVKEKDKENRIDPKRLTTSKNGKEFIKSWEALKLYAYDDNKGYATIGYGHLIAYKSIKNITIPNEFKNGITKEKADAMFNEDLKRFEKAVQRDITVNLHQYEFDALVSLLYNCGENFLKDGKAPNLFSYLKKKQYESAADEFADITRGGAGLIERRQDEIKMFKNNEYKLHK